MRGSRRMQAVLDRVRANGMTMLIPAGVVAEVWRDGRRQVRVAKLLAAAETSVATLDEPRARAVGVLLGHAGGSDVGDASVVLCAREHGASTPVLTGDPNDLVALDPQLSIVPI